MPRGMTPLTDSLALARGQIPPTAEAADIILVTDGLETCGGDPCALAADLAAEGIDIRAHVVGFGLTAVEVAALSCITDQTGGLLFQTNSGAELADALRQVSAPLPEPGPEAAPAPEPARAAFDLGDRAEAGFPYAIGWTGAATFVDYIGFVPQGSTDMDEAISYGTIGGTGAAPNNPVTRTAPAEPGLYDLVLVSAADGIIARQAVEVVAPQMGFEAIGTVEPGARVRFVFRGPERVEERIVIARPDDPPDVYHDSWAYALHKNGSTTLTVPEERGEYEVRYLNRSRSEVMFARRFGIGIPFADADLTRAADLAAAAAAATQGDAAQDDIAAVTATFRLPDGVPDGGVTWDGIPLDPDMQPEAWAPRENGPVISGSFEPGNWRITARAPGEVTFTADVAIFPGQATDVTLSLVDDGPDGALVGGWRIWAIPPRDIADPPMDMAQIDLALMATGQDYTGTITPQAAMGPAATPGDLISVVLEFETLFIDFAQPGILPDPFRLALAPQGAGYVGTMTMGPQTMPVAFWPADAVPDLALWQDAAFGAATVAEEAPGQSPDASLSDITFRCDQPRCDVVTEGLALTLEQGWSMTAPVWVGATLAAQPLDLPRVDFHGPDGARLHLNPHQWLADNGPCMPTAAGDLCLWRDGPAVAAAAAVPLAMSLQLDESAAALQPDAAPAAQTADPLTIEADDGTYFAGFGPYLADAEVLVFAQRGDGARAGEGIVVLGADGAPLPGPAARWLDDRYAAVTMPATPGRYSLALFDSDRSSLRAVTAIEVAADAAPAFTRYNPNPRPGRSCGLAVEGRMALTDRIAILTAAGDIVAAAGLHDALRGEIRLPEGAFGDFDLVWLAGDTVLARVALDVGGPPVLAPSGGSDGPAEIVMSGTPTPGGSVEVSVRGMIPAAAGTVGFIAAGSPDLTLLDTGSRVSPDATTVSVTVPDGAGPWALRLVDQNLIRVAEIPVAGNAASGGMTPVRLPEGMTADDLLDVLLPGFTAE